MPAVTEAQLRTALAQTKDRRFSPKPTVKAFGSLEASLREAIGSRRKAFSVLGSAQIRNGSFGYIWSCHQGLELGSMN
jgi:hypothetical protein